MPGRCVAGTNARAAVVLIFACCATVAALPAIAAAPFADPAKTLRVSMDGEEAGFDPQAVGDF